MALTRKLLSGMGLNEEQIDTIIEAHTDTVDGLKADVIKYKGDAEKLPGIQAEFDAYKKDVAAKEAHAAKEKAFRAILKDANLSEKGIEKAIKYAEWDKIELEADGKLKGASAHVKAAKLLNPLPLNPPLPPQPGQILLLPRQTMAALR